MSSNSTPPDHDYVSFLLRLWREDLNGRSNWRSVLQNAQTHEEQYYADVSALLEMLAERFTNSGLEQCHQQQSKPIMDENSKEVTDDVP